MRFCAFTRTCDTRAIILIPACARRRAVSMSRDVDESASAAALPSRSAAAGKSYWRQRESAAAILRAMSLRRRSGACDIALRSESTLPIRISWAVGPAGTDNVSVWARAMPDQASNTMHASADTLKIRRSITRINGQNVLQK